MIRSDPLSEHFGRLTFSELATRLCLSNLSSAAYFAVRIFRQARHEVLRRLSLRLERSRLDWHNLFATRGGNSVCSRLITIGCSSLRCWGGVRRLALVSARIFPKVRHEVLDFKHHLTTLRCDEVRSLIWSPSELVAVLHAPLANAEHGWGVLENVRGHNLPQG